MSDQQGLLLVGCGAVGGVMYEIEAGTRSISPDNLGELPSLS